MSTFKGKSEVIACGMSQQSSEIILKIDRSTMLSMIPNTLSLLASKYL